MYGILYCTLKILSWKGESDGILVANGCILVCGHNNALLLRPFFASEGGGETDFLPPPALRSLCRWIYSPVLVDAYRLPLADFCIRIAPFNRLSKRTNA